MFCFPSSYIFDSQFDVLTPLLGDEFKIKSIKSLISIIGIIRLIRDF